MSFGRSRTATVIMAAIVLVWSAQVLAVVNTPTLFVEDWENLDAGERASLNGWDEWYFTSTVLEGNIGGVGSKILEIQYANRSDLSIGAGSGGKLRAEFDFRGEVRTGGFFNIPMVLGQNLSTGTVRYKIIYVGTDHASTEFNLYLDADENSDFETVVTALEDATVYHFVVTLIIDSGTHHLTITKGSEATVVFDDDLGVKEPILQGTPFQRLEFGNLGGSHFGVQIDNIKVYPEPSVCGDAGTEYLSGDFDESCAVDAGDLAVVASKWLGKLELAAQDNATVYFEDWENFDPCNNPWTVISTIPEIVTGNIGGSPSGTKVISVLTTAGSSADRSANPLVVEADLVDGFVAEYDMHVDLLFGSSFFSLQYLYGQAGWRRAEYKVVGEGAAHGDFVKLQYLDPNEVAHIYLDVVELADKTDYHFVDVFSLGSPTHNLTISDAGGVVYQGDLRVMAPFVDLPFSAIQFYTQSNNSAEVLLDNITIASGKAPLNVVGDLNDDHLVDLLDFAEIASQWSACTDPADSSCSGWYW